MIPMSSSSVSEGLNSVERIFTKNWIYKVRDVSEGLNSVES